MLFRNIPWDASLRAPCTPVVGQHASSQHAACAQALNKARSVQAWDGGTHTCSTGVMTPRDAEAP